MNSLDPERTGIAMSPEGLLATDSGELRFQQVEAGQVSLPSGRIAACDGFVCIDTVAFERTVAPGKYPVVLSIASYPHGDQRVALATVRFSSATPALWQPALCPGQRVEKLKAGEFFGYPVDSGTGCFASPEALARISAEPDGDMLYERIANQMGANYAHTRDWACVELDPSGLNAVFFSSGIGDGVYGSHWGLTEGGEIACLTTDFGLTDPPSGEHPASSREPWFRRWMPTFFGPGEAGKGR